MRLQSFWYIAAALLTFGFRGPAQATPLVDAVKNGDISAVMSLLADGADVDEPAADGTPALSYAAYRNDLEILELLLIKGEAEVHAANDYGATPLYVAVGNADKALVRRLLEAGADPDAALLSGETPLMVAANRGKVEIARALLDRGADPNARESTGGQTALMWATSERHLEMVALLLKNGADPNAPSSTGFTPLMFAAQQGDPGISRLLVKAGADVDTGMFRSGLTPLMIASLGGFTEVADILMENGADIDAIDKSGKSVLHHAVTYYPSAAIVKELLARGADPDVRLKSPRKYVGYGIDPDGSTPLLQAAASSNLEAVMSLLDTGADPNIPTTQNTTPLIMAAGASVTADAAISDAEIERMSQIVKLLLDLGVEVNTVGQYGFTALHTAAYHGWNDTIEALIARGAETEIKDSFGQTPLSISQAIVTEGLGDDYRHTPRTYRRETAALLLSMGATPLELSGIKIVTKRAAVK